MRLHMRISADTRGKSETGPAKKLPSNYLSKDGCVPSPSKSGWKIIEFVYLQRRIVALPHIDMHRGLPLVRRKNGGKRAKEFETQSRIPNSVEEPGSAALCEVTAHFRRPVSV